MVLNDVSFSGLVYCPEIVSCQTFILVIFCSNFDAIFGTNVAF